MAASSIAHRLTSSYAGVVALGGLAQPFAAGGEECRRDVAPVASGRVAWQYEGGQRPQRVRPCRQQSQEWCLRMYRSRLRAISTIRGADTESVDSCSWWTAAAEGTYRLSQPTSRSRLAKSTSSE